MQQSPRTNFEIDVRPACLAYLADSTSIWKAKAAAQAINNFVEWTFRYYQEYDPAKLMGTTKVSDFKVHHAKQWPGVQTIWDLADAAKHRTLDKGKQFRTVTSSTGAWTTNDKTLVIRSTKEEVDVLIGSTMDYWYGQL